MTDWIQRYGGSLLLVVLAFAYITRMYNLHQPEGYLFDEVYHAVTAKLIAQNDPRAYEWWNPPPEIDTAVDWLHPPLAKYFQAASILAFGQNSFGWRFSSVVFGLLVIVLIYHLTLTLFKNKAQAVGAALLASLDGLLLVQSRIAMNDIFVTFFILLTLWCYIEYKKTSKIKTVFAIGIAAGLAIASKWSGVFVLVSVVFLESLRVLELWAKRKWKLPTTKNELKIIFKIVLIYLVSFVIIPSVIYLLSYSQMFLQRKDWNHFKELHNQIWQYQTNLDAEHPYQSRPWQWALDLRPVWYHVEYEGASRSDVYAFGNPALFWIGLVSILYSIVTGTIDTFSKKRFVQVLKKINTSPLFLTIITYCLVWLPWELSPRIMFFYHYTPAVPLLCIVLAYWLRKVFEQKGGLRYLSIASWTLIITCFIIWYPHWVGIPVSTKFKDAIYFRFTSWQ